MESFETEAQRLIDSYHIPGTAVGIAQDGELVYEKGFGYRNVALKEPVTMDTVFGIASVSKSFTCVAIMQLHEAGKLDIHNPVINYLPEFRTKTNVTEKMTIHHLMTHSSGLPPLPTLFYANKESIQKDPAAQDYPGVDFINVKDDKPLDTYAQLLEFIGELEFELLGEPGEEFSYSNDSYALLGAIIDRVSGKTYEQYLKDHLFKPAGMNNTYILHDELEKNEKVTCMYASRGSGEEQEIYEAPLRWKLTAMKAAGSIHSTVEDLLKYAEIYRNKGVVGQNRILTEASVQAMIYPHIKIGPGHYYGYGLMIRPNYYGGTLVEHGGNSKAVASQLCVIPERGVSGMILTNLAGVPATTILQGAINVFEGRAFDESTIKPTDVTYSEEELAEFTGEYVSNEGMKLEVGINEGQLTLKVPVVPSPIPVIIIGKDLFLATIRDQTEVIRFIRRNGKIDRVAYHFRQFPKVK